MNYKKIFKNDIMTLQKNDYKPIHLDKNFINMLNQFKSSK